MKEQLRAIGRWATTRAWSRAGAVAQVVGRGTPRRILGLATRVTLLVAGSMTIGAAVAVMLWNDFGPGPLDVFIGAIRARSGLPLTISVWLTVGTLIAIAWALGRRPGIGTICGPLIVGPTMQVALAALERVDTPVGVPTQAVVHLVAIAAVGLGAGSVIVSGLGAGTGELLAAAASDRSGRPEPRVRFGFEMTWVALGVALGGPIGLGTMLVAALIGPAVQQGHAAVDALVVRSRRQFTVAFGSRPLVRG